MNRRVTFEQTVEEVILSKPRPSKCASSSTPNSSFCCFVQVVDVNPIRMYRKQNAVDITMVSTAAEI